MLQENYIYISHQEQEEHSKIENMTKIEICTKIFESIVKIGKPRAQLYVEYFSKSVKKENKSKYILTFL